MRRISFLLCIFVSVWGIPSDLFAQRKNFVNQLSDSLTILRQHIKKSSNGKETKLNNPYYFRLFQPDVFSMSAVNGVLLDNYDVSNPDQIDYLNDAINHALVDNYLNHPSSVRYSNSTLDSTIVISTLSAAKTHVQNQQKVENVLKKELSEIKASELDANIEDIGLIVERPNFWTTKGTASMQFTQNYFSENWYKGGNNNQNLLASFLIEANYNDQKRITWENKLEMRLGFMTTTSDSCHKFLTSNDKINLHSKFGLKATKAWYYTVTAEANSQFMPGHKSNDKKTYSNFLAPLDVFLSVGMDFKPSLKNGNTFSVALLPLSYKLRHLRDQDANIHSVYNMVGINTTKDYGSKVELNAKLKLAKDFYWKTRCYYYTAYSYAEAELENSFTYAFSKYINAEVYTLWRFDDNRSRQYYDDNLGYFQFKEFFTLGLTYSF